MTTTVTPIRPSEPQNPPVHTDGLGELIRSYRLYLGLSQRGMAERLSKNRRDYQRIENNQDRCPPGMLSTIEALTDRFEAHVDMVLDAAQEQGSLTVEINLQEDTDMEWERNVAGRAAVVAAGGDEYPPIILKTTGVIGRTGRAAPGDLSEREQRRRGIFTGGDQRLPRGLR